MHTSDEKYIYPTLKGRIIFISLCVACITLYFLVDPAIQIFVPPTQENATIAELKEVAFKLNIFAIVTTIIISIFDCLFVGYFYMLGHKTIAEGEFPPEWKLNVILVKTKVKTGKDAYTMGVGSYILSGIFVLHILLNAYILWIFIKDI